MIFADGIDRKYRQSIEDAFATILERGNVTHRKIMQAILDSKMQVRVASVRKINASGVTGLISARATNNRIEDERLSIFEALDEVYITIAEETIDTGGQRGCEGTFVHEGQHAYDFARVIESFSNADINILSIFNPTLYELEWAAHKTSGEYMLQIAKDEYLEEGLQLMILGREIDGGCFISDDGINRRLRENYGLAFDGDQGSLASDIIGLRQRYF